MSSEVARPGEEPGDPASDVSWTLAAVGQRLDLDRAGRRARRHPVAVSARWAALCAPLRGLVLGERLRRVDGAEARMVGYELLRRIDAEPKRENRPEPGDLHRAESGESADPLAQVCGVGCLRPHALGSAAVLVGDNRAQLLHAPSHRAGEAVDRRALSEGGLELGGIHRRDPLRIEPADALLQLLRPGERGRHGHLLVEREADEEC